MTRLLLISCLLAISSGASFDGTMMSANDDRGGLIGTWLGTLNAGAVELRIIFHFESDRAGSFKGTIDSPDQGAKGIPMGTITLAGEALTIEIPAVAGKFTGTLNDEGTSLEGTWFQGGQSLPLNLTRVTEEEAAIVPKRPQEPKPPYPYRAEEVSYENRGAGTTISGTLTLPEGDGPFPAALLITGSGAQNRDEELLGHKPFLVLADYLTRHGISVLRVDDRGVGGSTGSFATATSRDFAEDVEAGVRYLLTRKEVNTHQIGLIGHSEGGLIAPMVAAEMPEVAYIVLMAGPGITGARILELQSALIARAGGQRENLISWNNRLQKQMYALIENRPDDPDLFAKTQSILKAAIDTLSADDKKTMGVSEDKVEGQARQLTSPWFRYFISYDPAPTLHNLTCPVLALNGAKDLQVPPKENLSAIETALKAGGNTHFDIEELPGLNHLFQHAETGSPAEYAKIEETISPEVLDRIATWVLAHVK